MIQNKGLSKPPEGVLVGESVPVENDRYEIEESKIEEVAAQLKAHPTFGTASESERREKAIELLEKYGRL